MVTPQLSRTPVRHSKRRSLDPTASRNGNDDHAGRTPKRVHERVRALSGNHEVGEISVETTRRRVAEVAETNVLHDLRIQEIPDRTHRINARMIEGGEDVKFIARRLVILASEDIGNANPTALVLATNCFQAVNLIGYPEAQLILSQCTTYLASSPKSNSSYLAIKTARQKVTETGDLNRSSTIWKSLDRITVVSRFIDLHRSS